MTWLVRHGFFWPMVTVTALLAGILLTGCSSSNQTTPTVMDTGYSTAPDRFPSVPALDSGITVEQVEKLVASFYHPSLKDVRVNEHATFGDWAVAKVYATELVDASHDGNWGAVFHKKGASWVFMGELVELFGSHLDVALESMNAPDEVWGFFGHSRPGEEPTTTTSLSTLVRLDDGEWDLLVDRQASLENVHLPGDQLSEDDYHAIPETPDPPRLGVTVSENGAKVSIIGEGPLAGLKVEGTRTSVHQTDVWYELDAAPGGRLVVWFTYKPGLQAEFTLYGSGRPMVLSYRGELDQVVTGVATSTTGTTLPADDSQLYPAPADGKWGYIDKTGSFMIEPQFDHAERFWGGLAAVTIKGKVGYIDKTGTWVIKPKFEKAGRFSEGLAAAVINGKVGFIEQTGRVAIAATFHDDGRVTSFSFSQGLFPASLDGKKWGYIGTTGEWVIQPQYAGARGFSKGLAGASDGRWGFIDRTGAWVIQPQFLAVGEFGEGLAPAAGRSGDTTHLATLTGYIDQAGEWVIEPKYTKALPFSEGVAAVVISPTFDAGGSYVDHAGNSACKWAFQGVDSFIDGLAVVRFGVGFYYMDKTGTLVFHGQLQPQ